MLDWRDEQLALFSPSDSPRYLIRFDQRDTGLSTEFPVPAGYTLSDMANDVEGLADHLDLSGRGFHVVGASMGGAIACIVAARRKHQVRSLTLVYASPGASAGLPLKEGVQAITTGGGMGQDRQTYVDNMNRTFDGLATQPLDDDERRSNAALVARVVDREMKSGTLYSKGPNHGAAAFAGWPGVEMLKDVACPSAVVQAAKDQLFGEEHGETLAKGLQRSEYVLWQDVGHELPRRIWDRLAQVCLRTWHRGDGEWAGLE